MTYRLGILSTHPIQYYSPWYRAIAAEPDIDLKVYYAHRQTPEGQAAAGFGVPFEWDVPLLDGYEYEFLSNVARHPDVSTFSGCDTPAIAEIIAHERFDAFLVHGWYNRSFLQAIRACRRTGTPVMVRGDSQLGTPRPLWWRLAKSILYRQLIRQFDAYLVVGQRSREYYLAYGADSRKMFFSPHFVDNEFFAHGAARSRQRRDELRGALAIPPRAILYTFVGKLISLKRVDLFITALAELSKEYPNVAGLLVGEGPLRSSIDAQIHSTQAPIVNLGFRNQSELCDVYAMTDVIVLPSDTESWGLVVNEAMAAGVPAIVSNRVGCAPDLVRHGISGYIFSHGDARELLHAMRTLCEPSHRAQLSMESQRLVAQYSVREAIRGLRQALDFLVRSRSTLVSTS